MAHGRRCRRLRRSPDALGAGYVQIDGQKQWLTVIGGDHYYFKSHLAADVAKTIKRSDVELATMTAEPGINAFEVRIRCARSNPRAHTWECV